MRDGEQFREASALSTFQLRSAIPNVLGAGLM
jgi:hypothetical protein